MRFKARNYALMTERMLEAEAEKERVAEAQILRSDAEREAASYRPADTFGEWAVYDLTHGGAYYEDGDPHKVTNHRGDDHESK